MKSSLYAIFAVSALTILLLSAGCIQEQPAVKTEPAEIPAGMHQALNDLAMDLSSLEVSVISDMTALSSAIGAAENDTAIQQTISQYYAKHPCLTAVIFRDTTHGDYISVPVILDIDLSSYSANITEQDFRDAGGFIVRNNVFTKYHGYQNLYYKPVYSEDGDYHGYLIFVADIYSLLYLHPSMLGIEKSYDDYICFIADEKETILYSSIQEAAGTVMTPAGYYDGLAYIPSGVSGDGACKYESRGFYIYDGDIQSEKITGWHTLYSSHGRAYTLYLIERLNLPELQTENIFTLSTGQALNDTRAAFIYAYQDGKDKTAARINSGYYETPLSLLDMNGNVLASSNPYFIGKNFLNIRGMYGVSYVESAILAAEQGGGYVYYLTPVERVVSPRAAEYTLGIIYPISNQYYIYSKIPGSTDAVMLDDQLRPDLTLVSHGVLESAIISGIPATAEIINKNRLDAAGMFASNISAKIADIAILDREGTVYASVVFPELIGKSATFMTDVYGGSLTRRSGMLAQTGGGYLTQLTENPEKSGYVDLWVALIEPVDTNYYTYTSVYIATFEDVLSPYLNR